MEFKEWTKGEIIEFCENNWIEEPEWLYKFVEGTVASIEMDDSENKEGNLIVVIQG